ncbi:MAG: sugar phosphate isomerase/epimerase [Rhodospirillales bacterium]|nr:MAG: sugar phosphate isomerase/epimerase [Rhodospirillales bacterium]
MSYQFSLAHLTLIGASAPELTYIAARAGYDFVSLRLIPMGVAGECACPAQDKAMMRATRAALDATGIELHDVELARIVADRDPKSYVPAMEVAAELGARHLISSAWTTDGTDRDFIVERFAEICDLAAPFGLTVDLEFPTFSRLTNLREAADIVRTADRPNAGILIDTIYTHFSQLDPGELDSLPREWWHFIHIADAPGEIPSERDDMIHIARDARLYPGEGCVDFEALLGRLPPVTCSIELPNLKRVEELGYEGHARRCLEAARRCLEPHSFPETPAQRYIA